MKEVNTSKMLRKVPRYSKHSISVRSCLKKEEHKDRKDNDEEGKQQ